MNRSFVSLALVQSQILGKPLFSLPIMHCFSLVIVVRFIIKHISSQMMTSYCSKLMENLRTEISIAMLCIFTVRWMQFVSSWGRFINHFSMTNTVKSAHPSPLLSNNLYSCPVVENFISIEPLVICICLIRPLFICPKGALLIQVWILKKSRKLTY